MVARELARVCRPSGTFTLCNWTREGKIGRLFALRGRYLPPPPSFASSPALWGDEAHVRGLFADLDIELSFEPRAVDIPFASPEHYVAHFEQHYGPTIKARAALEPQGRGSACARNGSS